MSGPEGAAQAGGGGVCANRVRYGFYLDSIALMRISASLSERDGVEVAALMIGSPSNLAILDEAGLLAETGRGAGPNDLVLAVRAADEAALDTALAAAEDALDRSAGPPAGPDTAAMSATGRRFPGLRAACDALPGANLALISVPGPFAAREARRALARGLHVLIFSDNVTLEDEAALKQEARRRGLLIMGPDCGTALIDGTPLAFANRVRRGDIGVIAASGTGLQELSVLVHRGGGGISHGIGVGGRDLSDEIGGSSTFAALELLEADPGTRRIVIVSKPPGRNTEALLLERLRTCPKPVTLCLVGRDEAALPAPATLAPTLRDAARHALARPPGSPADRGAADGGEPGGRSKSGPRSEEGALPQAIDPGVEESGKGPERDARPRPARRIVGLYSGGTLCAEGQAILRRAGLDVFSNAPIPGAGRLDARSQVPSARLRSLLPDLPDRLPLSAHILLDLGADEYTVGRPHPMIDPSLRGEALAGALSDPAPAALVVDVILGTGSHPDPAGAIARAIESAPHGHPLVIASVCGTELDPQDAAAQRRTLERAGVLVAASNADAVEAALGIASGGRGP